MIAPRPWAVPVHPYDFATAQGTDWLTLPPERVSIAEVVPTQDYLMLNHLSLLLEGFPAHGGDRYSHIVEHRGRLYSHDGHHRDALAWLQGRKWVSARVLRLDE